MNILEMLLLNGDSITKGFTHLFGKKKYEIARKNGITICFFHHINDIGRKIIEKFIDENYDLEDDITITTEVIEKKDLENMIGKKIVILEKEFVLYNEVLKRKECIKNFKNNLPKYGINKYEIEK